MLQHQFTCFYSQNSLQSVYGREPPNLLSYVPGTLKVEVVDNMLQARDKVVKDLRCQLQQAQARMKTAYDQG